MAELELAECWRIVAATARVFARRTFSYSVGFPVLLLFDGSD